MKAKKTFDCVAMALSIQERIGEQTLGMSCQERYDRLKARVATSPFAELWRMTTWRPSDGATGGARRPPRPAHRRKKAFDCVEMKHRLQQRIREETDGMTGEERAAYHRRKVQDSPFAEIWHRRAGKHTPRKRS